MINIHQGIDIVDIAKFREVSQRNKNFIHDIFTIKEREYCFSRKDPYIHLAGRFAAKEACLKSLGWGLFAAGVDHIFQDMEIVHNISGKPLLVLTGWAGKISKKRKIHQHTVSISHSSGVAVASVIMVGEQR